MALIKKLAPVGKDVKINEIQVTLYDTLINNGVWSNYQSYFRAQKNKTKDGLLIAEVFTSGNDYKDVFTDDEFFVSSFFIASDSSTTLDIGIQETTVSMIFQADLKKLYPLLTDRVDESFTNDILNIFNGFGEDCVLENIKTGIDEVYSEFDKSKITFTDMQPYFVVRFDIKITYNTTCGFTQVNPIVCDLEVTVSTTPPSVEGGDDGTATANPTGGSGSFSYLWNTTPTQTTKTATNLSAGTYSVFVKDEGLEDCMAIGIGSILGTCAIVIDSVDVTAPTVFGGDDGQATVNFSGSTGPASFSWNTTPKQTTQTATGLSSGQLCVGVTDTAVSGCQAVEIVDIPMEPNLPATHLWLMADDPDTINPGAGVPEIDDPVATWGDLSGNGFDPVQTLPGNRPLWKGTYLKGDGNDFMTLAALISKIPNRGVYIIMKADSVATSQYVFGDSNSGGAAVGTSLVCRYNASTGKFQSQFGDGTNFKVINGSSTTTTALTLYSERYSSGDALTRIQINGVDETEVSGGGSATSIGGTKESFSLFRIGAFSAQQFIGRIYEMILLDHDPTDPENTTITNYLQVKYPELP